MVKQLSEENKIAQEIEVTCSNMLHYLKKTFVPTSNGYRQYINWYLTIDAYSPTRVEINQYWGGCEFNVYVNPSIVVAYAEKYNIDIGSAAKLLVAHEVLHIVLGHFNKKYENHDKKILNIAGDLEINQLIGLKAPALQVEDFGYRPYHTTDYYYDKLMKDFKAEQDILPSNDMDSDSSNSEDDSSDMSNDTTQDSENDNIEDDTSMGSNSEDSTKTNDEEDAINNIGNQTNVTENNDTEDNDIEDDDIEDNNTEDDTESSNSQNSSNGYDPMSELDDILEDKLINEDTEQNLGQEDINISFSNKDKARIENVIKKEVENIDYTLEGLSEIIRKIERVEKSVKIMPHNRVSTYHKFNNRRKSDFILPGRRFDNAGITRKFDSSPIVFIDVSYSTQGSINRDLNAVAKKLHEIGATIVYYESDIVNICEPDSIFFSQAACGGTNITNTIEKYLREVGDFNRAYVFTDGQDRFDRLNEVCDKFNVYFINNSKVKEIFNEKNYDPHKWYRGSW